MTTEGVSFSRTSRSARVNSDQGTHVGGEELERLSVAAEDEVILTPTNRRYSMYQRALHLSRVQAPVARCFWRCRRR